MEEFQPKIMSILGNYTKQQFFKDVTAGIIVAIIALPLSIALAISSGVSPEQGLFTAIVAGFLISLLGGSRVQIGGPTGAFMVIVYGIVKQYGMDGLIASTIMAGIIMVILGLFKMGSIIKFIPYPITTGFTSGIALVIFSSQIKDFFGLQIGEVPAEFVLKWKMYIENFNTFNIESLALGILSLLIIIFWPKINKKIPGTLIALVASTLIASFFSLDVETIGSKFGHISSSLPAPSLPQISFDAFKNLVAPAFTIAILGSVESLLSAVVADGMINGKHRSNMELVAQGIANVGSGIFGGIPATGAIARTVANIKNGGRTPVAGMVHAVVLLFILVTFMPLASMIPLSSLAAVLVIVAYNMSEWRAFKALFKAPKSDIFILMTTFLLTVFLDLVKAIEIGMVISALLFMKRMSDVAKIEELDLSQENFDLKADEMPENIQVYEVNGPFFFGAADKFMDTLKGIGSHVDFVVLGLEKVPAMDATAIQAFRIFIEICKKNKTRLVLHGIQTQPQEVLEKSELYEIIGSENIFDNLEDALEYVKRLS